MQDTDLADIKQQCVSEMLKICISEESDTTNVSSPYTSCTEMSTLSEPSPSIRSVSKPEFFFPTLVAAPSNKNSRESPIEEIEQYSREKVILSHDFDVLQWWIVNENRYPLLSKVALKFLSIVHRLKEYFH